MLAAAAITRRFGRTLALDRVDFQAYPGEIHALVGENGAGKSTLINIFAGRLKPDRGVVTLDGAALPPGAAFDAVRSFHVHPLLLQAFAERVREAAEIASLEGDIEDFTEKYETIVGERGITLSGGQKQRTAIARALVRDPRILILDDSLSAVDTQTEERILSRLRGIMAGRTTILISHRTSTVQDADQIVVLRDGQIIERGKHEDLLARGGYYADLYQKQLLEEELERA